jgi:hypothetical protein
LNTKTRVRPLLLAATVLILVALACGSSTKVTSPTETQPTEAQPTEAVQASATTVPASADGAVKMESYQLRVDNGSGEAGDEVKNFKPSDHTQYFEAQLNQLLKAGSVVKWVFTAVDTTAGKDIKITEVEVKVVLGNNLTSHLSMDNDFPVGTYKADIFIDGKPLTTIDYSVAE